MKKLFLAGLASLALASAPVAHAAAPARSAAPVHGASEMGGESSVAPWALAILIIAGIVFAISEGDNQDSPDSP